MFKYLKSTFKSLKRMMKKEVREGQKHIEEETKPEQSLKTLRKRKKQVETARIESLKKNMKAKKAKRAHQHRMRSTPGEVDGNESAPAMAHREGKRWIQNSRKKTKNNNKLFTKSSLKRS